MRIRADDDGYGWRSVEPCFDNVPSLPPKELISTCGQSREIRECRAGHEARGGPLWKAQKLGEPALAHRFELSGDGRHDVVRRVLIPHVGEDPCGHADR